METAMKTTHIQVRLKSNRRVSLAKHGGHLCQADEERPRGIKMPDYMILNILYV